MKLDEILDNATVMVRKGPIHTVEDKGVVRVHDFYLMPHTDEIDDDLELVDVHFVNIGVDKRVAEELREDLKAELARYPEPDRLRGGPSYIEVGAVIGSQDNALRLYALGKVLGFWDIITPESFGMEGKMAEAAAGRGLVMITGYREEEA